MSPVEARRTLEARSSAVANQPVTFVAGGHSWPLTARRLEVSVNWRGAVSAALRQGEGSVPLRGFRRLGVRLFGADVTPAAQAYDAALQYELDQIARRVDRRSHDASLRLVRRHAVVMPGRAGLKLERSAAARTIVQALASLQRPLTVDLPVAVDPQRVTAAALRPVARQVRTALSAPVQLAVTKGRFELRPYRLARLLDLPRGGRTDLRIAGIEADSFFVRLDRTIERPARDATFVPVGNGLRLVPARKGRQVDVPATARSILQAALSPTNRLARLALVRTAPHLTTAEAKSRGHQGGRRHVHDGVRRDREPDPQRPARRAPDRRPLHPAARGVLVQPHDGLARRVEGIPRGAGDHQRRAPERARRRCLPGVDDGLQRRIRGGAADHVAHESRALHLALSPRPRRDGQLPRHRPPLRQRHRPLAPASQLRRRVVA